MCLSDPMSVSRAWSVMTAWLLLLAAPGFAFEPLVGNRVAYEGDTTPDVPDALGHTWSPNSGGNELTRTTILDGIGTFHWYADWTNYTKIEGMRSANTIGAHSMGAGGSGVTFELRFKITTGLLELFCPDSSHNLTCQFSPTGLTLLSDPPRSVSYDGTAFHQIRLEVDEGRATVWVGQDAPKLSSVLLPSISVGNGGVDFYARSTGTTDFELDYFRVRQEAVPVVNSPTLISPHGPRTEYRGNLKVDIGETRMIMRGPMFPGALLLQNGSMIVSAAASTEGGPATYIRSTDRGYSWRPFNTNVMFRLQLQNGKCIGLDLAPTPVAGQPGYYQTIRYESTNNGLTVQGPFTDGRLYLPTDLFPTTNVHWFHGNMIQMPNGDLLAPMQGGTVTPNGFRTYLVKSTDEGKNWSYVSMVATLDSIDDPEGRLDHGWTLWGPVEPSLLHLGDNRLLCVMRVVNDDLFPMIAAPTATYRDLFYTLMGSDIYPGTVPVGANDFLSPGPQMAPLISAESSDAGATWSRAIPMDQARGMAPQLQASDGIIALTYGGLAYPRWGNCISFSQDGGKTWSEEINFAPFFTTGYTGLVVTEPGTFTCIFDAAPPQPWTRHAAHWVGAVDIAVTRQTATQYPLFGDQ